MLAEIIFGAVGEAVVGYAADRGLQIFKSANAKKEISSIGAAAIEAGITKAPAMAEDLRSISFVSGVFIPLLQATIKDPSRVPDADALGRDFVEMFVERFATNSSADEVLVRIFQTERHQLLAAFSSIIRELRSRLYASELWRESAHYLATEQILSETGVIRAILERNARAESIASIDLDKARKDAKQGSTELRDWPRDISGAELLRPELERLKCHLERAKSGTALLIGEAGSGKSALLSKLTEDLESDGHIVFGIRADTLPPSVQTIDDVGKALGLAGPLAIEIAALAKNDRVYLIIDQLDAVSDVMDRSSERMRLLLRLVKEVQDQSLPVHVLVSSRPFEAAHDARFQRLRAEEFKLGLPSVDQIVEFLGKLGLDGTALSGPLKQTLRRPFALKLFVQLAQRGVEPMSVRSSELLDRWLATADLGPDELRARAFALMTKLAEDMLETETLWRPLDQYEAAHQEAIARCEGCGLLVRSGTKIGFNHQSWLDDFQARSFRTGGDLAEYAWRNQDSLFVRATVLRSLERLRLVEFEAYVRAVNALLWTNKTRRHLKHLIADVIGTVRDPDAREGAWVETLIQKEPILANRALGTISDQWPSWRPFLSHSIGQLMKGDQFHWRAVRLLAAEAKIDPDNVITLINAYWSDPSKDHLVFDIAEQSGVVTDAVEALLRKILERTKIDQHSVSHFVTTLRTEERFREAARLVAVWLSTVEPDKYRGPELYNVEKLVEAAPEEFAEEILPWFVRFASLQVEPYREGVKRYPQSRSLPWDWDSERERGRIIEAVRDAMRGMAKSNPAAAMRLLKPLLAVEVEQIQELIAQTITSGAEALAEEGFNFLLSDERRLQLGTGSVEIEPGCSSIESGLTSQELIEAICPYLSSEQLALLRNRIEAWSLYAPSASEGDDARLKRDRLRWIEDNRLELLERLPGNILSPRRRRQIAEWRARKGRPIPRRRGRPMATLVGSPMSQLAMAAAKDDDIFKMLDEINDEAPERSRRRPIASDGGVVELSRAFAAFGKDHPQRAFDLAATRFVPGKHEHAAGYLIDEISKTKEGTEDPVHPPSDVHQLILDLSERGFSSRTWKTHSSWALSRLADDLDGLPDGTIAMLEGWLENDAPVVEEKIERRLELDAENERRNKREKTHPEPLLFHRYGGMRIVPQDNYSVLSAIFHGLIGRKDRDYEGWLAILERHAAKPEDPHIWIFLLADKGRWLVWADRERVQALLTSLWERDRRIFLDVDVVGFLWSNREMIPSPLLTEILSHWFEQDDEHSRQAGAEFVQALVLVDPDDEVGVALADRLRDKSSPELVGRLLSTASAWREDDQELRERSHALLVSFAPNATGDEAHAISSVVDKEDHLLPDDFTREMIDIISGNPELLSASLTGRFANGLQGLLLYPGFDEAVMTVTERVAELIADEQGGRHRSFIDGDFVQVTVALQRSDGPLRAKAMDVYEKLLDAGAYGAEEAARAAISR